VWSDRCKSAPWSGDCRIAGCGTAKEPVTRHPVAGLGSVVLAVAAGRAEPGGGQQKLFSRIGTGWLLGWLGLLTAQASQAARTTET
jgi:hypothetical protein